MATVTVNAIYIGNFAEMDPDSPANTDTENPDLILGSYTPAAMEIVALTQTDANDDGAISDDDGGAGEAVSYTIGGTTNTTEPDASLLYRADVTDDLGSTATGVMLGVVQMANGDVFVLDWGGALDNMAIAEIELTGVVVSDMTGYQSNLDVENSTIAVCFGAGTRIRTARGDRPIDTLRQGDLVHTLDHGLRPVRWVLHSRFTATGPAQAPVEIGPGALGVGLPRRRLVLSANHRVMLRSEQAARMFGAGEVFVAAKQLVALPGIRRLGIGASVAYWHLAFDRHDVVLAEGCPAESLYPGKMAFRNLSAANRLALAQALRGRVLGLAPPLARLEPKPRDQARLVARLARGRGRPLEPRPARPVALPEPPPPSPRPSYRSLCRRGSS